MKIKKILGVGLLTILLIGIVGVSACSLVKLSDENDENDTDVVERLINYVDINPDLSFVIVESDKPMAEYFYRYEGIYYQHIHLYFHGQISSSLLNKVNEYNDIDKLGIIMAFKDELNDKTLSSSYLLNENIYSLETTVEEVSEKLNVSFKPLSFSNSPLTDLDREFVYCSYFVSGNKYYFGKEVTSTIREIAKSEYESSLLNNDPSDVCGFLANYHRDSCLDELSNIETKRQIAVIFSDEENGTLYHDEQNGYAKIAIRACGQITRDLYDRISRNHMIEKFGVAIVKQKDLINYMMKRGSLFSMLYQDDKMLYLESILSEVSKNNDYSSGVVNWYGPVINIENEESINEKWVAISYLIVDGKYEFLNRRDVSAAAIAASQLEKIDETDKNYNTYKYLASFAE